MDTTPIPIPRPLGPKPPMAIASISLFCENPQRLAQFYQEKLGLPMLPIQVFGSPIQWACELQHVSFSLRPISELPSEQQGHGGNCVTFYVSDVALSYQRLVENGVKVAFPPRRTPTGITARFIDPEGNLFELYQPLDIQQAVGVG